MDHFDDGTQYQQFFVFFKQNTTSIHQFIMSNLVNLQSFIVIRCKLVEIWDPELGHFYIFPCVCNGCWWNFADLLNSAWFIERWGSLFVWMKNRKRVTWSKWPASGLLFYLRMASTITNSIGCSQDLLNNATRISALAHCTLALFNLKNYLFSGYLNP